MANHGQQDGGKGLQGRTYVQTAEVEAGGVVELSCHEPLQPLVQRLGQRFYRRRSRRRKPAEKKKRGGEGNNPEPMSGGLSDPSVPMNVSLRERKSRQLTSRLRIFCVLERLQAGAPNVS